MYETNVLKSSSRLPRRESETRIKFDWISFLKFEENEKQNIWGKINLGILISVGFFFEDESGLMLRKLYKCLGKGQGRQKSLKFQTKIQRLFQWNLNHSKIEANLINQEIFQALNSIIYQRFYSRPIFHTNCITNIKKLIQFLRIPLYFLFLETQKIWNNRNSYF